MPISIDAKGRKKIKITIEPDPPPVEDRRDCLICGKSFVFQWGTKERHPNEIPLCHWCQYDAGGRMGRLGFGFTVWSYGYGLNDTELNHVIDQAGAVLRILEREIKGVSTRNPF